VRCAAALAAAGLLLAACGEEQKPPPTAAGPAAPQPAPGFAVAPSAGDAEKGRQVWLVQCVSCHHPNPEKDGPVGPAVKGSSEALVEARVLSGGYPPGYTPKRDSKVMPARPDLARSIADLAAFLR
jgi:mono/diheme cytochrome c family protein